MKNNRTILVSIVILVLVTLFAACENSSDESSAKLDNESQNNNSFQDTNNDFSNVDSTESTSNIDTSNTGNNANAKEDVSNNVPEKEENPSTNHTTESLKEEYLNKLNDNKKETDGMEAEDTSTYALKKVENDRWDIWDELLNEIYGVLKEQLPPEEMDRVREEQRNWIKYRDDRALEASLKYKGGTQEHLEYVTVLANLTEERCYELVEDYMK